MIVGNEEVLQHGDQDDTGDCAGEAAVVQAETLVEGDHGGDHAGMEQTGNDAAGQTETTGDGGHGGGKADTHDGGGGGQLKSGKSGGEHVTQHDRDHVDDVSAAGSHGHQADDTTHGGAGHAGADEDIVEGGAQTNQTDVGSGEADIVLAHIITLVAGFKQEFIKSGEVFSVDEVAIDHQSQAHNGGEGWDDGEVRLTDHSVGGDLETGGAVHK